MGSEANLGRVQILRPYAGFETEYQGRGSLTPIMFTQGGEALDPGGKAGTVGYAPNLLKGLSVPVGSQVVLWLPVARAIPRGELGFEHPIPYRWTIRWRFRSTHDFNKFRIPYSFGVQEQGAPDTSTGTSEPRVLIPAATEQIIYTETEPTAEYGSAQQNGWNRQIVNIPGYIFSNLPFIPGGTQGIYEQGVTDPLPGNVGQTFMPFFSAHVLTCKGNELLIECNRDNSVVNDYDFTGPDAQFSGLFGNGSGAPIPGIGVYMCTGTTASSTNE